MLYGRYSRLTATAHPDGGLGTSVALTPPRLTPIRLPASLVLSVRVGDRGRSRRVRALRGRWATSGAQRVRVRPLGRGRSSRASRRPSASRRASAATGLRGTMARLLPGLAFLLGVSLAGDGVRPAPSSGTEWW